MAPSRSFLVSLGLAATLAGVAACRAPRSTTPASGGYHVNITISRTDGMRDKHFSARLNISTNWTMTEPVWTISRNSGPLPPGLALNRFTGEVSGTPTEAGFWTVRFNVRDRTHGTDGEPTPWADDAKAYNWYYEDIELRIYDKLTE